MQEAELFSAIQKGDSETAISLLAAEPALCSARNANGVSALMLARYSNLKSVTEAIRAEHRELDVFEAATFGDVVRLRALLDADPALVNARSGDGGSALHFSCFFGQPECARELVRRGADIHAEAAAFGNVQPLHSAAAGRSAEIVKLLLEAGADPKVKQGHGWTALHSAAQHGDADMSQTLLRHGADSSAKADNGQTPLDLARVGGHAEVAALLEKAG